MLSRSSSGHDSIHCEYSVCLGIRCVDGEVEGFGATRVPDHGDQPLSAPTPPQNEHHLMPSRTFSSSLRRSVVRIDGILPAYCHLPLARIVQATFSFFFKPVLQPSNRRRSIGRDDETKELMFCFGLGFVFELLIAQSLASPISHVIHELFGPPVLRSSYAMFQNGQPERKFPTAIAFPVSPYLISQAKAEAINPESFVGPTMATQFPNFAHWPQSWGA